VKREAPPGQLLERCSVAPVQRQKATRFAGRRASQPSPFDDDGPDSAATQEISDRGADDAATAYKDPHSFTRPPVSDTFGRIIPLGTLGVARLILNQAPVRTKFKIPERTGLCLETERHWSGPARAPNPTR